MFNDCVLSGSFTTPAAGNPAQTLQLPFLPDLFEIWIQGNASGSVWTGNGTPGSVKYAMWQSGMASGTALCKANTAGAATDTSVFLASNGISLVTSQANTYGLPVVGTGITNATPAVLTITPANAFATGDIVLLGGTTGALQFSGIPWYVTSTGANTYTLGDAFDASAFAAPATAVTARKLLYPYAWTPYVSYIVSLTTGSTTTVQTSIPHGLSVNDTARLLISADWGSYQISGQSGIVSSVIDPFTFVININSSAANPFVFPTSAQFGAGGASFAQVIPFGNPANAFDLAATDNNFQGIIIGNSATAGSAILNANNALCVWRAQMSARVYTSLTS